MQHRKEYGMGIHCIPCGMANCCIVSQNGSAILVDTATTKHRESILAKCRAANVRLIVLTHGHYDHAQNAAYLAKELCVPVAMHPADLPLMADILSEPIAARSLLGKTMLAAITLSAHPSFGKWAARLQKNEIPPFAPDIELREGFSFEAYGVDATVIELPGHTRGSIGVAAEDGLIAGDALMNFVRPRKALHYIDRAAMEASAARISAMGDILIYFGHGGPVKNREW